MGVCYSLANAWRPDWAWPSEPGFRYEWFYRNFQFVIPGTGAALMELPIRIDDDGDFLVQAIHIPQLAIVPFDMRGDTYMSGANARATGLARIRTSDGKQLSTEMILSLGAWAAAGFAGISGTGPSINDPLIVPAGGVLSLDVQCTTNATWAVITATFGAATIFFEANVFGVSGNGLTIELIDPAAPNVPLSAAVVAGGVEVTLGTDGASTITSTVADVVNIINDTTAVAAVMMSQSFGDSSELAAAVGPLVLDGAVAATDIDLYGAFMGWKRIKTC